MAEKIGPEREIFQVRHQRPALAGPADDSGAIGTQLIALSRY